jgi:hypothetical protein
MGVRVPEDTRWEPPPPPPLSLLPAAGVFLLSLLLFLCNGRPIGAGDTRVNEHVAASLAQEGDFDLDEYPLVEPPFAREVGGRRLSVYPVVAPLFAAPVFLASRMVFALDDAGTAVAGKLAAALLSALAVALFARAVARRGLGADAVRTALLLAAGTGVWATSQALWQHPASVLALCAAVLCLVRAEHDDRWAGRAGLPLALAVAARHADVALAGVLAMAVAVRWPRRIPHLLAWAAGPVLFTLAYDAWAFGAPLRHGFSGTLGRFSEPWGVGHAGLLVSPAKGLLVFTPLAAIAAVGLVRALRHEDRRLALSLGAAVLAHWALIGRWSEWHGGAAWGPRLMTDALPLLFLFLPEGFQALPKTGAVLAAFSVGVQALGAFAYDGRWERLHQKGGVPEAAALWDPGRSPILFYVQRRVAIVALPDVRGGRVRVRERRFVLGGQSGSRVHFEGDGPVVTGAERTIQGLTLERGARVEAGRAVLSGRWDGVAFSVPEGARPRRLELRVAGRGRGLLYVGEDTFWADAPRWSAYPVAGPFVVRHPYAFAQSGGPELSVTVGRGGGEAAIEWLALVAPSDPLDPLRLP